MVKKSLLVLSISVAYFANAQDVSTIRNTIDVYSNSSLNGSSKYNAMAGSMGALGGDVSVLNSNPAGIAVSIASEFSGTLFIESNTNKTSYGGSTFDYKVNKTNLGNTGGIAAFHLASTSPWKFVNVAVNYSNQSIEDYSETPGNSNIVYDIEDNTGAVIDNLSFAGHAYNRYGNLSKMSVGFGGNYDNRIYVGAGLNFHSAAVDQYDTAAFTDKTNITDVYNKQYTPFSETSNGFSATLGIIGKINHQLRVGASLESPTWWNIERIYSEYANSASGDGTYSESRNLSTPLKATVSAAFVANKNFAINVDYSLGLTKAKYTVEGPAETDLNQLISNNAKNLSEIKVGAEYRISDFRLRGGYAFASNPFNSMQISSVQDNGGAANTTYNNLFGGKRNTIGAGIGYDFKSFYIDAAYQNITSEYSSPFIQGSFAKNTGYFSDQYVINSDSSIVSKVKNKKDNFFITLGWKF